MTKRIRIGIVGAHFGARVHTEAFRLDRRAQVVALAARSLESARSAAKRSDIPAAYAGWRSLLKDGSVDAISIAVPPRFQPEIIREALSRRISVFAEKPLALSLKEAEEISGLAKRSGVAHMVDYELTEIPAWIKAKELLSAGAIGSVRHISVIWRVETYANRFKKVSWKTQAGEGGGALSAFGCHTLHALDWFTGPVREISAYLSQAKQLPGKGDSLCVLGVKFRNGVLAHVEICTHAFPPSGHEIRFFGEKGQILLTNPGGDYVRGFKLFLADRTYPKFRPIKPRADFRKGLGDGRIEAVARLVNKFLDWIALKKSAAPNFLDALRVERLLEGARQSAVHHGRFIKVS